MRDFRCKDKKAVKRKTDSDQEHELIMKKKRKEEEGISYTSTLTYCGS